MSSVICFNLDQSKILSSGNGLREKEDRLKSAMSLFSKILCSLSLSQTNPILLVIFNNTHMDSLQSMYSKERL